MISIFVGENCINLAKEKKLMSDLLINQNRILGEVEGQIQEILVLVFENYKSLDEKAPSGMMDIFGPATGLAAPALAPTVKLYALLHDVLSSEAQLKFCRYFQVLKIDFIYSYYFLCPLYFI